MLKRSGWNTWRHWWILILLKMWHPGINCLMISCKKEILQDFLQERKYTKPHMRYSYKIQLNLNLIVLPDLAHSLQKIQDKHTTKYQQNPGWEPFYRTKDLFSLINSMHEKAGFGGYFRINETRQINQMKTSSKEIFWDNHGYLNMNWVLHDFKYYYFC